jgi:hypothetical protein
MKKEPREKRYRYVSHHAIERLRERIIALDMNFRFDKDLEQWLDSVVEQAVRKGDVQIVPDHKDTTAKLVDIGEAFGAPAFALLKPNDHPRAKSNGLIEAVITVLDDVMVAEYRKRRWSDDKHRPFAALAGMKIAPPPQNGTKVKVPDQLTTAPEPKQLADEQLLISYVGEQGIAYKLVTRTNVKHECVQLALEPEVEAETIRVWREVPGTVRVSVELDL